MTASIWLRDVFSYGLQLTLIIATGAALAIAFRLREPQSHARLLAHAADRRACCSRCANRG